GASAFRRVIVIVFENRDAIQAYKTPPATAFRRMAERHATLRTTMPSRIEPSQLPRAVSRSTRGVRSDRTGCVADAPNLADTLAADGNRWLAFLLAHPPFARQVAAQRRVHRLRRAPAVAPAARRRAGGRDCPGPARQARQSLALHLSHYSLLRTIEE